MVHIIGQNKNGTLGEFRVGDGEFRVGDQVQTTPQYKKYMKAEHSGQVCKVERGTVTFYSNGGKETLSEDWLIRA